ncbi:MAG: DNA adenine methylase [Deltaproteobacteria bacterium]|nr:DNA adenine methylase [Deltaproteobacteria bacterium]
MIKYLGSKRRFLERIVDVARTELPEATSALDLFSGSARVGHAFKGAGLRVLANDHNEYARTLARCYVEADDDLVPAATRLIADLQRTPARAGWFTHTYCEQARFFHPKNGARVEAIRERIDRLDLAPLLRDVALVSLMEAADRVDSTVGVHMAYLKAWAPRAHNELELRVPKLLPRSPHGRSEAHGLDAEEAARTLAADVAYLDPPYNQHSYLRNYHVWETLVRWDQPATYGVAAKRVDCKTRASAFNLKRQASAALERVVDAVRARVLIVSFNDEGFLDRATIEDMLSRRGPVRVCAMEARRYVGARIGIYNPRGEKVGAVGKLKNHELLYVVRCAS